MSDQAIETLFRREQIRRDARDDQSRDLGIIASGQMALHCWIAAFGTLKSYAAQVGPSQVDQSMGTSLDEARKGDRAHTALAGAILRKAT